MESPPAKTALIQPSWLRVIIFVLAYLGINLIAYQVLDSKLSLGNALVDQIGKLTGNPDKEFNFILLALLTSFILSVILVIVFMKFVERQSVSSLGFHTVVTYPMQ